MVTEKSLTDPLPWGVNGTVPQLFYREHNWAKAASMIWLESPAGVGFSYCDYGVNKTSGKPLHPCTANDTSTAVDNNEVLKVRGTAALTVSLLPIEWDICGMSAGDAGILHWFPGVRGERFLYHWRVL
eukprot:SAG11_NODE_719_length_7564_cov_14.939317_7_plen_128_part_00